MKFSRPLLASLLLGLPFSPAVAQITIVSGTAGANQVSTGGVYEQKFNTLVTSGSVAWTDNSTLPGWYAAKGPGISGTGKIADNTPFTSLIANYATPNNTTSGNLYSLAQHFTNNSPTSAYRALGSCPNSTTIGPVNMAVRFVNNTASIITGFSVNYEIKFGYSENSTGSVTDVAVANGGSGSSSGSPPTVTFTGSGGSGAAGTAIVSGGAVVAITMTNGGSGYTTAPAVSFSGSGGATATAIIHSSSPASGTNTVDLLYKTFTSGSGSLALIPTGWATATTTSISNSTTSAVPDDWNYVTTKVSGVSIAPGQEVWLDWRISKVSGSSNSTITAIDNVRVGDFAAGDPAIMTQPLDQSAITGRSVTFYVVAAGSGSLTYQWRKNGANIPSATAASYTIASAQLTDIGAYDVVVTSGANTATSSAAKLKVYSQTGVKGPASVNVVTAINVTNGGSGYSSAPAVTLTGGQTSAVTSNSSLGANLATATAIVSGSAVTGITITNGGNNYSAAPTVSFSGGGGTGASATAAIGTPGITAPAISYTPDASLEDIQYVTGTAPAELGDLYLPNPMPSSLRPAVVIIHGGGGNDGDKLQDREVEAGWDYASHGYVAMSINYKRSFNLGSGKWSASWPQNIKDAKSAVRWLRAHAATYNIDPNRIGAIGFSWGGNEAAMLATTKPSDTLLADGSSLEPTNTTDGNGNFASSVACASNFYGAVSIPDYHNMNQFGGYGVPGIPGTMDYASSPNYYPDASPAIRYSVNSGAAPMLLTHGDADLEVMPSQNFALKAALQNAGNRVDGVILVPDGLHSYALYDTAHGGSVGSPIDIRPQTFGFFDRYLLLVPSITSLTTASGTQERAFSYQITATNSPTGYSSTALPSGLSLNTATGLISGTATTTGTFPVTVSAANADGTDSTSLTITLVTPPAPVISSSLSASGTVGATFTDQSAASYLPTSFNATGRPAWLSINTSTGALTGAPTSSGTFTPTISANNAGGSDSKSLSIVVKTQFASWTNTYLAAYPPAAQAATADPDGDGMINIFEYALGGNPAVSSQTQLPQSSTTSGRLAITFTRTLANADITMVVQGADNPGGSWSDLASSVNGATTSALINGVTVIETGAGATRNVEVRDLFQTSDAAHPRRFMRLQVQY